MGYTKHIITGAGWMGGIRVVIRLLTFAKTLIIARALSPNDFGLFGITTLVLTFVEIFTETGVNVFLIQEKDGIDKYIDTAWVVSIFRGILIALAIAISAPLVATFFHSASSAGLLLIIALVPLARGFINPSIVKFQKDLLFQKGFYYQASITLVEAIVSSFLVIITHNVVSLIWGLLFSVLFEIGISFFIISPQPKFYFVPELFKRIIGYGKWITASTIFNYFYQHGDDIAVGRFLGTGALGIYDMAYKISLVPLTDIAEVATKVTFPVYVRISDDKMRLKRAFLRSTFLILLVTIPIGVILFLFPSQIIRLVLGEKWLFATDVLKVLAIFGVIRALSVFGLNFLLSVQKQQIFTVVTFIGFLGLLATIIPFIHFYGIVGAGLSALFGTSLTIPFVLYFIYKYFGRERD